MVTWWLQHYTLCMLFYSREWETHPKVDEKRHLNCFTLTRQPVKKVTGYTTLARRFIILSFTSAKITTFNSPPLYLSKVFPLCDLKQELSEEMTNQFSCHLFFSL